MLEENFNANQLASRRLTAFVYQDNNFNFIFGDMKNDFLTSDLKGRFNIPDRGLALKKIETCFNGKGVLEGFRFYDKQDQKIFE